MYITDALVCGSRNSNTSDRSYLLFTREAGMVWASARSVREERSKQRFALQEFSLIRATLVRGKASWRIAGVEPMHNLYYVTTQRDVRGCQRNIMRLLRRVMQGENPQAKLYDDVVKSLKKLGECNPKALELVLSLRILRELGYVAPHASYAVLLECPYAYEGVPLLTREEEESSTRAIDIALESSQL